MKNNAFTLKVKPGSLTDYPSWLDPGKQQVHRQQTAGIRLFSSGRNLRHLQELFCVYYELTIWANLVLLCFFLRAQFFQEPRGDSECQRNITEFVKGCGAFGVEVS